MKRKQKTGKWRPYVPTDFDENKLVSPPIDFGRARTSVELRELQSLAKIRKHREYERRSKKLGKQHAPECRPAPGTPEWDCQWREVAKSAAKAR